MAMEVQPAARSFSPSVQMTPAAPMVQQQQAGPGGSVDTMALLRMMAERDDKKHAQMDQQREEMEAKLEARLAEMKASLAPAPADPAIPEEHLTRLQTRLESLGHTAKLLNDEELSVRVGGSRG